MSTQRVIEDPRSYSAFTFGYNRTLVAERCADLLSIVAHALDQDAESVSLVATDGAAPWTAPAAALAGKQVERVVISTDRFRFADVRSYKEANFVPGAVKYGDLPVLLALRAPLPLTIVGEPDLPKIVVHTFEAEDAKDSVQHAATINDQTLSWLLK